MAKEVKITIDTKNPTISVGIKTNVVIGRDSSLDPVIQFKSTGSSGVKGDAGSVGPAGVDGIDGVGLTTAQANQIGVNGLKITYPEDDAAKLSGISIGAEVNVRSDWNSISGDSEILNKPFVPLDLTVSGQGVVHANNYTDTDTIYTHPSNHSISVITGLQSALNGKINNSQVLTDVPSGALFTDTNTVYTHPTNHAISVTTGLQAALDGKVDDSQILTDVPSGALFTDTDTVYTHPANHAISVITGLQSALDGKVDDSQVLTDVPSGALFTDTDTIYSHPSNHAISVTTGLQSALDGKVDDGQVLTDVPSGALFTDTNTVYDDTTIQAEVDLNTAKTSNIVQTTITGNAGTATALTSGSKTIAGTLDLSGATDKFVINNTEVAQVASGVVTIGQTNRVLKLDSSETQILSSTGIQLGHATDTTIARVSAGVVSIEGVNIQKENAHHHFIHAGFFMSYPYSRYIPLNGSLNEQNTATSSPEYVNFTFPYDGFVKKMILRTETDMGSTNLKLYKGASGSTVTTALGNLSATVDANDAITFDFTSVSNAYSKGDTMAIKIDPTDDPDGGQNITIELVFDLTT